jgi:hypothetical protein
MRHYYDFSLGGQGMKWIRICHPVLQDTHTLNYFGTDGPRADLLFRGEAVLVAGTATVDIDAVSLQTAGTFVALTRDPQIWVHNATGWDAVRGSISGNTLTITCQDVASTDTVHWLVVADRYDDHMQPPHMEIDEATGRPLVERLQPDAPDDEAQP